MLRLTELENGKLQLKIVDREDFETIYNKEFTDERDYLGEMLEDAHYTGNDWHVPYDLGLTEIPAITYGAVYNDEEAETPSYYEKVWGFSNYMIDSYLDELKEKGVVIFDRLQYD